MSKKWFGLALAGVLVLTMAFGACGEKSGGSGSSESPKDSYDIVMEATNKVNDAKGLSFDLDLDINMTIDGSEQTIKMSGPVSVVKDGDDIQMSMEQSMSMLGMDVDATIYYRDGFAYTETLGMKMKQAFDSEEFSSQQNISLTTFDKTYIKSSSDQKVAAGTEYSYTIDGKGLKDLVAKNLSSDASLADVSEDEIVFGDAKIVVVIDAKGKVVSQSLDTTYEMTISGQTVVTKMIMNLTNIKTDGVTIDFPTDLDTYSEITL